MSADNFSLLFGSCELEKQIGSGTDGRVYRLAERNGEVRSAVKIIRLSHEKILEGKSEESEEIFSYSDEEFCAAFIKNITDNIDLLRQHDKGRFFCEYYDREVRPSADGSSSLLFIRMELLTPLSDFLGEYAFTQQEVLRIAVSLCGSLDKCRDFGFIYPNLKPENVMFDSKGRCKPGDFGTFCCTAPLKSSVAYRRTQQYMAPEFYKTGNINETCDTYSLGLILYALLNRGRLPFVPVSAAEPTMNELSQALERRLSGEEIPAPCMAGSDVSAVVLKALSFEPEHRYRTPRHMLSDLKKLLNGEEIVFEEEPEVEYAVPQEELVNEVVVEPISKEDLFEEYKKEYTEEKRRKQQEDFAQKKTDAPKESSPRPRRTDKRSAIDRNQKIILVLLTVALLALIITVIVLAVKYAGSEELMTISLSPIKQTIISEAKLYGG